MTFETLPALLALAVATLFTPGPNNALLAASGANFGFRRTLPHLLGVALGFTAMLLIVGLALGGLFQASNVLREGLRWGGAALLLWIAWKIATADPAAPRKAASLHPMTFAQAAGFQWINPKAWSMAVAATSQFVAPSAPWLSATVVAASFLALGLMSSATWALAGQAIARWLTTAGRMRVFNIVMAALIALSVVELVRG
jgi:threonine/homoserine/homoserine lactone efflux protein